MFIDFKALDRCFAQEDRIHSATYNMAIGRIVLHLK